MRKIALLNRRVVALALVAGLLLLSEPGAEGTEAGPSPGQQLGKDVATKLAMTAAQQLGPMVLDELGIDSPFVNAFFGLSDGGAAPQIDYERIAGLVADVYDEGELRKDLSESQAVIDQEHTNLRNKIVAYREARKLLDEASKGREAAPITMRGAETLQDRGKTLADLEHSRNRIDTEVFKPLARWEDRGVYVWAAGANVRLGAGVVLARERGTNAAFRALIEEVDHAVAKVRPYADYEARINYLGCGDADSDSERPVVDTFDNSRTGKPKRLTWPKTDCPNMLRTMKGLFSSKYREHVWIKRPGRDYYWIDGQYVEGAPPNSNFLLWDTVKGSPNIHCSPREGRGPYPIDLFLLPGRDLDLRINGSYRDRHDCFRAGLEYFANVLEIVADAEQKEEYLRGLVRSWLHLKRSLQLKLEFQKAEKSDCVRYWADPHYGKPEFDGQYKGHEQEVCGIGVRGKLDFPPSSFICGSDVSAVAFRGQFGVVSCEQADDFYLLHREHVKDVAGGTTYNRLLFPDEAEDARGIRYMDGMTPTVVALGPDRYRHTAVPPPCVDIFTGPFYTGLVEDENGVFVRDRRRALAEPTRVCGDFQMGDEAYREVTGGIGSYVCGSGVERLWLRVRETGSRYLYLKNPGCKGLEPVYFSVRGRPVTHVFVELSASANAARSALREAYVDLVRKANLDGVEGADLADQAVTVRKLLRDHRPDVVDRLVDGQTVEALPEATLREAAVTFAGGEDRRSAKRETREAAFEQAFGELGRLVEKALGADFPARRIATARQEALDEAQRAVRARQKAAEAKLIERYLELLEASKKDWGDNWLPMSKRGERVVTALKHSWPEQTAAAFKRIGEDPRWDDPWVDAADAFVNDKKAFSVAYRWIIDLVRAVLEDRYPEQEAAKILNAGS